jgi:hypothetical protein
MSSQLPQSGGLGILLDWANAQYGRVRAIVGEVISTRRELAEQSLDTAYDLSLADIPMHSPGLG